MSFYEENVAEGIHCMECKKFIGAACWYPRKCTDCTKTEKSLVSRIKSCFVKRKKV